MSRIETQTLPALGDNYIFLLSRDGEAAVIDPGDGDLVLRELHERDLHLKHILLTHHHADHIAGAAMLAKRSSCTVWGPEDARMRIVTTPLADHEGFDIMGTDWSALHVPGHTRSHLAYQCRTHSMVFTGDALFVGGCGRLFEGTAEQMWASLQRLAMLPEETRVYCGHEYTEENYRFAHTVDAREPVYTNRLEEVRALLAAGQPTVPSTIGEELRSNVFLRAADAEAFAGLRKLKDAF